MATTIFPQNGDVGGEQAFQNLNQSRYNWVMQGFSPSAGTGLNPEINNGEAIINGVYLKISATTSITVVDNTTNYVYLQIQRSGGLVQNPPSDSDNFLVSTTEQKDDDLLLVAIFITASGSVSTVVDMRWIVPGGRMSTVRGGFNTVTGTTLEDIDALFLPYNQNHRDESTAGLFAGYTVVKGELFLSDGGGGVKFNIRSKGGTWVGDVAYTLISDNNVVAGADKATMPISVPSWSPGNDAILRFTTYDTNGNEDSGRLFAQIAEETSSGGVGIHVGSHMTIERMLNART
jgi:hypothetical protein